MIANSLFLLISLFPFFLKRRKFFALFDCFLSRQRRRHEREKLGPYNTDLNWDRFSCSWTDWQLSLKRKANERLSLALLKPTFFVWKETLLTLKNWLSSDKKRNFFPFKYKLKSFLNLNFTLKKISLSFLECCLSSFLKIHASRLADRSRLIGSLLSDCCPASATT